MPGCRSCARRRASFRNSSTCSSDSKASALGILTATSRLSRVSKPRRTVPNDPSPRQPLIAYLSIELANGSASSTSTTCLPPGSPFDPNAGSFSESSSPAAQKLSQEWSSRLFPDSWCLKSLSTEAHSTSSPPHSRRRSADLSSAGTSQALSNNSCSLMT